VVCVLVQMSVASAGGPSPCCLDTSLRCATLASAIMLTNIVIEKLQLDRSTFPCWNFEPGTRKSATQLRLACTACWEFISSQVIKFQRYISPANDLVLFNGQYLTEKEKASLKKSRVNWVNNRKQVSVTTFTPMGNNDSGSTMSAIVPMQNRSATDGHSLLPSHTHARASFQGSASEKGVVVRANVHNAADNVMDMDEDMQDHRKSPLNLNADASAGIAVLLYIMQLTRAHVKAEKRMHPPCLFCASVL
jgi:hypothetical protein